MGVSYRQRTSVCGDNDPFGVVVSRVFFIDSKSLTFPMVFMFHAAQYSRGGHRKEGIVTSDAKLDFRCPGSLNHPQGVWWVEGGMETGPHLGGKISPGGKVLELQQDACTAQEGGRGFVSFLCSPSQKESPLSWGPQARLGRDRPVQSSDEATPSGHEINPLASQPRREITHPW